jgi:hypothetical protein
MPISAPQRAMEVFRSEFDAAWEFGGLWISAWHPACPAGSRVSKQRSNCSTICAARAASGPHTAKVHDIFFEWVFFRLLIDRGDDWPAALTAAANLRCWPVQVFGVERSLSGLAAGEGWIRTLGPP